MIKTAIVYTKEVNNLKKIIGTLFKTKFSKSYRIRNIINHSKLSRMTKLQISGINRYLRKQGLFVRVVVKGNNVWEIWY
jgi:hypothetical protein